MSFSLVTVFVVIVVVMVVACLLVVVSVFVRVAVAGGVDRNVVGVGASLVTVNVPMYLWSWIITACVGWAGV